MPYMVKIKNECLNKPPKNNQTYMPYMVIIKMNTSIIHPVIVKLMPYMVIIKKPIPIKEPASDIYF